jgi:hypothetical protein
MKIDYWRHADLNIQLSDLLWADNERVVTMEMESCYGVHITVGITLKVPLQH